MPRIYADVQEHTMDWGHVDFTEGVAAIPTTADTTYWTGASYAVDTSKHALDVFDKMAKADLQELLTYLGVSFLAGDTKQALVRKAETFASTALITALTVASIAGTKSGDSKVTITGALGADGNTLAFKTGKAVLTPLYKDIPVGYTTFVSAADITPTAVTDTKITVVELNAAGEIVAIGSDDLTLQA